MNNLITKKITWATIVLLLFFSLTFAQEVENVSQNALDNPVTMYLRAKELVEKKNFKEAEPILANLLKKYPDDYSIFELNFENTVKKLAAKKEFAKLKEFAIGSLPGFRKFPIRSRTAQFYQYYSGVLRLSGKAGEHEAIIVEAISRHPKSPIVASFKYDQIKKESDPEKLVDKLEEFIKDFEAESSVASTAAKLRFKKISESPTLFSDEMLLESAKKLDELMFRRSEQPEWKKKVRKDHTYYPWGVASITEGLEDRYPKKSVEYAVKALEYSEANKKKQKRLTFYIPILKQSILSSYVKLEDWKKAKDVGDEIFALLEDPLLKTEINEASIRRNYAITVENMGMVESARKQFLIASILNSGLKSDFEGFNKRYPIPGREFQNFEKITREKFSKIVAVRDKKNRDILLKKISKKKASPFNLKDINGKQVSLEDFSGKVVFLGIWATWCAPCIEEMKEIQVAYERYKGNPKVAFAYVCSDAEEGDEKVAKFIEKNKYTFPIYYNNSEIDKGYPSESVPRLFVIDPAGNVRFEHNGYVNDGYFQKRIDWTVEELTKKPSK